VNYTPAEATVTLTVAEVIPASITWLDPHSISYGTPLSAEQLNAASSIPGSFVYAPAAGEVLPAGKHKLSVIFTPKHEERYAKVQANVTLLVEELPNVASLLGVTLQTRLDQGVTGHPVAAGTGSSTPTATTTTQDHDGSPAKKKWPFIDPAALAGALSRNSKGSASLTGLLKTFVRTAEPETVIRDDQPAQNLQRETRLYRGAVYTKGDDGQWHLHRE
jgi:hypothetical protein